MPPTPHAASALAIQVDPELCTGCDVCRRLAPATFEIGAQFKARVKVPPGDQPEVIVAAALACPKAAITVLDRESGRRLAPAT
jgi:ferredoxin